MTCTAPPEQSLQYCMYRQGSSPYSARRKDSSLLMILYCLNTVLYCHNLVLYCHHLVLYCHNLVLYCHNLALYCHNLVLYCQIADHKSHMISLGTQHTSAAELSYSLRVQTYNTTLAFKQVILMQSSSCVIYKIKIKIPLTQLICLYYLLLQCCLFF
jgi:hypothetical protein